MKVKGIKTISENVSIEVDPEEIISLIETAIKNRHSDLNYDYIQNGNCMVFDYVDGHNGTDEYKVLRPANKKDLMYDVVLAEIKLALRQYDKQSNK